MKLKLIKGNVSTTLAPSGPTLEERSLQLAIITAMLSLGWILIGVIK